MTKRTIGDIEREKRTILDTLNSKGGFINKAFAKAKARRHGLRKDSDGYWYDPSNKPDVSLYSSAFESDD